MITAYDLATNWKLSDKLRKHCLALAQAGKRAELRDELRAAWADEEPMPDAARIGISDYLPLDPEAQLDDDVIYTAMTRRGADVLAASRRGDRL